MCVCVFLGNERIERLVVGKHIKHKTNFIVGNLFDAVKTKKIGVISSLVWFVSAGKFLDNSTATT